MEAEVLLGKELNLEKDDTVINCVGICALENIDVWLGHNQYQSPIKFSPLIIIPVILLYKVDHTLGSLFVK